MENLSNKIIKKPWGYEYSVYEDGNFCIWFLHINECESTSMHCHPNKTTKLVLLDGTAKISFLSNEKIINGLDFAKFDRGEFHSTRSLSQNGIYLFEIESSNDKDDLVRLSDKYGREDLHYEFDSYKIAFNEKFNLNTLDDTKFNFSGCYLQVFNISNAEDLPFVSDGIYIFLKGILYSKTDSRTFELIVPGDVIKTNDFSLIKKKITFVSDDCKILLISKE
jgi:mannose-6-phosphate isomerase-like protein (cupin superfamily)